MDRISALPIDIVFDEVAKRIADRGKQLGSVQPFEALMRMIERMNDSQWP